MKSSKTTSVAAIVLVLLVAAPALQAQRNCGNQDFKGTYGILASGHFVGDPFPPLTMAMTGRIVADGKGNASAQDTVGNYGGFALPRNLVGTYNVSADCRISFALLASPLPWETEWTPFGFEGAMAEGGQAVGHLLVSPPGAAIQVLLRAQNRSNCSNEDVRGGYLVVMSGTNIFRPGVPQGYFNRVGRLEFDGKGGFSAQTRVSYAGSIVTEAFSGTYAVDPLCDIVFSYELGGQSHSWLGALTDNSSGASLLVTGPSGAVVSGTMKKQ